MADGQSFLVWHVMIGFGRFKVWFERDDDGDYTVGLLLFGLKLSYLFQRRAPADPVEPT